MIYLGTLGRMVGIKCPSSQSVEHAERYSFDTTLEGRVKAQARPIGRRSWNLQTSPATTPAEHSLLSQFADGAWGAGPFYFFPADATVTNLLTPDQSMCDRSLVYGTTLPGGPMLCGGQWAAMSWMDDPLNTIWFNRDSAPIWEGQTVTGSAWVLGDGARVQLQFYGPDGPMGVYQSDVRGNSASPVRSVLTMEAPAGATSVRLRAGGAMRAAMPAITFTGAVQPWSDGQGCLKAVVSAFSRDQVLAVPGNTFSNVSFTVTEVG